MRFFASFGWIGAKFPTVAVIVPAQNTLSVKSFRTPKFFCQFIKNSEVIRPFISFYGYTDRQNPVGWANIPSDGEVVTQRRIMTNEQFTGLIGQYEKLVFTVCYQMVQDYQEAQNLAQDTFLSAYQNIDRCPADSYRPWLCRIAANKAKDYLKSAYNRRVTASGDETLDLLPAGGSPADLVIEREGAQRVKELIHSLKEPYQKVSILFFLEEKTVEEIAQRLDRPPKTVQTQLYRAKRILQQQIREEEPQ